MQKLNFRNRSTSLSLIISLGVIFTTRDVTAQDALPHSSCAYTECQVLDSGRSKCLRCSSRSVISVPDNFNLSRVPLDLEYLEIKNFAFEDTKQWNYIPERPNLTHVSLQGNLHRMLISKVVPFSWIIGSNNKHIRSLSLVYVKIGSLKRTLFDGFRRLEVLLIAACAVDSIDSDVFEGIGVLPGQNTLGESPPSLKKVLIYSNSIDYVDWSFLRPVSDTLEVRNYNGQLY